MQGVVGLALVVVVTALQGESGAAWLGTCAEPSAGSASAAAQGRIHLTMSVEEAERSIRRYRDGDGDGQGDPTRWKVGPAETGWVANDLDCDDADPRVHALALDRAGDGADTDCDGCDGRCPD